ncbi:MAG: hypothetical protein JXR15_12490 [Shimia sp.]|uniref:hypothetical protein n=1 Tax=Shimia sp. TaxID=1954381 RepID=UPI003B8DDCDB
MADENDLRIAELKLAQTKEQTLHHKADADAKKRVAYFNFVLGGLIGGLVAFGGSYLNFHNKDREIDLELARISLTILSGDYEKDNEDSYPARVFALDALQAGTGVTISDANKQAWARTGNTPAGDKFQPTSPQFFKNLGSVSTPNLDQERLLMWVQVLENEDYDSSPEVCILEIELGPVAPNKKCGKYVFFEESTNLTCVYFPNGGKVGSLRCGPLTGMSREDLPW